MSEDDLVRQLISQGESTKVDRKLQLDLEDEKGKFEFCKDLSAMANTYGGTGYLLIGIENKSGAVIGIDPNSFDGARMQQVVNSRCHPHMDFSPKLIKSQGKWVCLITIPESPRKPHRVREGTRMSTFVRRGDTTAQADTDEILSMFASSQAMEGEDRFGLVMSPAEVVLGLSMFVSIYALIRPLSFVFGLNASVSPFDFATFVITFVMLGLVVFMKYLFLKDTVEFLAPWRRMLSIILLFQLTAALWVTIITIFSMRYPAFFRQLVIAPWEQLMTIEFEAAALSAAAFLLVEGRFPTYLRLLRELRPDDPRLGSSSAKLPRFSHLSFIVRNRKFVAIVILALMSAVAIQPLDSSYGIFTPRIDIRTTQYGLNQFLPYPPANYFLSVVGDLKSANDTGSCVIDSYESFNETVSASVPKSALLSVDSFSIPNPSNVSTATSYPQSSSLNGYYTSVWNELGIANTNRSAVSVAPSPNNVSSIEARFSNETRGSKVLFSLVYFQKANPAITCSESISYAHLSNGSAIVRAEYILVNHELSTAAVEVLQVHDSLEWLTSDPLYTSPRQVTLYWGNHTIPYSNQGVDQIYPDVVALPPSESVNYTVIAVGTGIFN